MAWFRRLLLPTGAVAAAVALAACGAGAGGGAASGQGGGGGGGGVDPIVAGYQGPKVDLSGVTLRITSPKPDALNIGSFFMFDKLRQWGASVDVVILTTTSGIQTMVAGRSDLASQGADEVILGNAEGAGVTAIGSPRTKQDYVLVAKQEIKDVAGLKGHAVAMSGPSGFDTLLSKYALQHAGLDPARDARFVQIGGSPDRASALLAGTVDAATIFLSDWEELKRRSGDLHLLANMADQTDFPGSAYYAKSSYLEDNPKVGLAVACANLEANDWLNTNKADYVKFTLSHVPGSTRAAVEQLWQDATQVDMWPRTPTEIISENGFGSLMQAMVGSGEIKKTVPLGGMVDTSFLEKAADMGCGGAK